MFRPPLDHGHLHQEEFERIRKLLIVDSYHGKEEIDCHYYLDKSEAIIKQGYINSKILPKPEARLTK